MEFILFVYLAVFVFKLIRGHGLERSFWWPIAAVKWVWHTGKAQITSKEP